MSQHRFARGMFKIYQVLFLHVHPQEPVPLDNYRSSNLKVCLHPNQIYQKPGLHKNILWIFLLRHFTLRFSFCWGLISLWLEGMRLTSCGQQRYQRQAALVIPSPGIHSRDTQNHLTHYLQSSQARVWLGLVFCVFFFFCPDFLRTA